MSFIVDKQTLEDLNLLGKYKPNTVYSMFNKVRTAGGERLLDDFFREPLQDVDAINHRSRIFQYFERAALEFPFNQEEFELMENYLNAGGGSNPFAGLLDNLRKKMTQLVGLGKEFPLVTGGLYMTIKLLNQLQGLLDKIDQQTGPNPVAAEVQLLRDLLASPKLRWLAKEHGNLKIPFLKILRYDNLLRFQLREQMAKVLQVIYQIDVWIAVGATASARKLAYATALPKTDYCLHLKECRHPGVEKAVANSVSMEQRNNVLFLTGANMAGKSTFMKSFAIAVYLAHMGFPVAAEAMKFSIRDGICTSINVPDDLQQGYSHFYAEVRRVKMVAETVSAGKDMVIIFDELFKGTNVKDAYDATLACTKAFAAYRNCFFIVSTHIIEVAQPLKECCNNLQFVYFPTIMEGSVPRYTYKLREGVTADRHGMMIIENEGVVDLIRRRSLVGAS